jgi:hypothetical protein
VDVDEGLVRPRHAQQLESLAGGLAEPAADREHEVAGPDPLGELGVGPEADVPRVAAVVVVEQVLPAEAAGRGQVVGVEEGR